MKYEAKNFEVATSDGVMLRGVKYSPEKPARAKIFFLHGLSVPKEGPANILAETAQALAENGFEIVAFNFRGHGDSDGNDFDVALATGLTDFDAIFNAEKDARPFGVLGFSYGAAVAINYFAEKEAKPSVAVLFSPALDFVNGVFMHAESVMGQAYKKMIEGSADKMTMPNGFHIGKKMTETAGDYPTAKLLPDLSENTLIIQGRNDQMMDFNLMEKLGRGKVAEYVVLDAVHGLTEEKAKAIQLTIDWFAERLDTGEGKKNEL